MPPKRKRTVQGHSGTRRKSYHGASAAVTPVLLSRSNHEWNNTLPSESAMYDSKHYHVGDMVIVNVGDRLSGVRQEPAVIAACRGLYLLLFWLFETKSTKQRRKLVGVEIASTYRLILSTYSDVNLVSTMAGHMPPDERKQVCLSHFLELNAALVIPITEPRDDCFMRRLVNNIKAREVREGSATPSPPLDGALRERDENREPAGLRIRPTPFSEASASGSDPDADMPISTASQHHSPETSVEPDASGTASLASWTGLSSEEDTDDIPAEGFCPNESPPPPNSGKGSHDQERRKSGSNQPYNATASESPLASRTADLHGPPLPVGAADGGTESEDQHRRPSYLSNPLKQSYDQTASRVSSRLQVLRQHAKAEAQQLPQHLKDGLITFLESFGPSVPVHDPEYLWYSGRADSFSMPEGKNLLVTTLSIFQQLSLCENHKMPKYVLIKNMQPSSAMETHWKNYLLEFLHEHPGTYIEIQDVTDDGDLTFEREALEVHSRLSNEPPRNAILRQGGYSQDMIPWNVLSLHGGHLHTDGVPAIQGIRRFGCLATLCEKIEQPDLPSVGKNQGPKACNSAFSGCLNFALIGERASYSKIHVDLLGSTGIEILFGRKAWFLLDGDMTDEEKAEFAEQGQEWKPSPARVKMVPLGPGDTLLMMPGHLSPHMVITVETCLSRGGMFWDEFTLPRTLEHLLWTLQHPRATNEHVDFDVTRLIDAIQEKEGLSARGAHELKKKMRRKFSCKCKNCGARCRCSQENDLRTVGCTTWCACDCKKFGVE